MTQKTLEKHQGHRERKIVHMDEKPGLLRYLRIRKSCLRYTRRLTHFSCSQTPSNEATLCIIMIN